VWVDAGAEQRGQFDGIAGDILDRVGDLLRGCQDAERRVVAGLGGLLGATGSEQQYADQSQ
jgi:hypothetical protein